MVAGKRGVMKNLFASEIAERLNVSMGTLHKKEFQNRIGIPLGKMGKRIFCPEPIFEKWVFEKSGFNK